MKRLLIYGSTGSIGTQTLDIVRANPDRFCVAGLTCNNRIEIIREQVREFRPAAVCVGNERDAAALSEGFPDLELFYGPQGLIDIAEIDADMAVSALMGISGLAPTYRAIQSGKDIALANKETLVTGGAIITEACRANGVRLLPVDSEHSAIFQCLEGNRGREIKRILLTCSGGPFRNYTAEELAGVTVEQALAHPKWNMGNKITIDSATLMNKGLEVIEARWLFDVPGDRIDVHIHPESIVHSMVEFCDTSVIAQLGLPDMRIPISLALAYPERLPYSGDSLDFFSVGKALHFERPRRDVFRTLDLAYEALRNGGSAPVVLNGANEELVAMFLAGRIGFLDIQNTLIDIMGRHRAVPMTSVEEILAVDREARAKVRERFA
ncbi:MAG: 1-deoxy-D-xylulose-5-phosphate reductoisomerase [Mogibacterium sp.]|nr:1-deoxy-D-xylulose-5-phosphate reductoisomerase [Mogibacterium sp.]